MLPSELLRARRRGDRLIPLWARGSELELAVAKELISIFKEGKSLREIEEEAEEVERLYETFLDYKFVRGIFILLERKAEFRRPETPVNPMRAREVLYRVVNERYHGFVLGEVREEALRLVAHELGVDHGEVERVLWADFDENLRLVHFPEVDPKELLREYNLSLLQTALFKSVRMIIRTKAPGHELKPLLRSIKGKGLMYTAWKEGGLTVISVDGPASVLKMTTKYGTALAKVVPSLMRMSHWELWARIVRKFGSRKSLLKLEVSSSSRDLFPEAKVEVKPFDSEWERELHNALVADGWRVEREPDPLIAGSSVMIPDFKVSKGLVKVYIELVGFWTPDYVRKKVEKVRKVKEPVLLVVRKDLLVAPMGRLGADVLLFERRLDKAPLIRKLKELERSLLPRAHIKVEGDLVSLGELSRESGYTKSQLKDLLKEVRGYSLVGGYLISQELLDRIRELVLRERPRKIGELKSLLRKEGLPTSAAVALAEEVGLKVRWRSLEEDEADLLY